MKVKFDISLMSSEGVLGHFDASGDKTNRYDQCDYACHDSSNLRKHMKVETSQINAISVTMHPLELAI